MATKKQMQAFNDKVEKYLLSIGAKKKEEHYSKDYKGFCYQVNTKAGLMNVSCWEPEKSRLYSIFVRFEDSTFKVKCALPSLANVIGLSGKWNIHEDDEESAMNCLEYRIEKTALPQHTN